MITKIIPEEKIQKAQMGLTMSRPDIGLGTLVDATADSMRAAAANEGGMGAAMSYMGMNMANQAGAGLVETHASGETRLEHRLPARLIQLFLCLQDVLPGGQVGRVVLAGLPQCLFRR